MDPEIQQKLRKAAEDAAELASTSSSTTKTLTVREIIADIAKIDGLSANGKAVLEKVLGTDSFEDKTTLTLTVEMYTDPWQLKPTSTEVSPSSLPAASRGSFASNETLVLKAKELSSKVDDVLAELAKELDGKTEQFPIAVREAILKAGPAASKLEQLKDILKITDAVSDYDLRWRVSEVVGLLTQFAQVESILADVSKAQADDKKRKVPKAQAVWPGNMAAAQFDKEHGVFKCDDLTWGRDGGQAPR